MIRRLIFARIVQFGRGIRDTGYIYAVILFSGYFLIQYLSVEFINSISNAVLFAACVCVIIFLVHKERADRDFIIVNFDKPGMVFFTEYFLLSIILMPAFLVSEYRIYSVIPVVFSRIISFSGRYGAAYSGASYLFLSRVINPVNFEWISGMRKSFIIIVLFYTISIAFVPFKFAALIFVWLLASFVLAFYRECESFQVLIAQNLNPAKFLKEKIKSHCILFSLFIFPIVAIYLIFNPSHILFVTCLYFVLNLNLVFTILYKYSLYEPGYMLSGSSILVTLVQLSVFLPFLIILTVVMVLRNYIKAKSNLTQYMNA